MAAAAAVIWLPAPPSWGVIVGSGAGWLIGVAVTVARHRTFERAGQK
jgi:hypothetical protein